MSRVGVGLIVAAFIALQATNNAVVAIMGLFVTETLGLDVMWAGVALGVAAGLEIPALLLIGRLTDRFSSLGLIASGCLVGIAYYVGMVYVTGPVLLVGLQVLNAWFFAVVAGVGLTLFQQVIPRPGLASGLFTNTRRVGAVDLRRDHRLRLAGGARIRRRLRDLRGAHGCGTARDLGGGPDDSAVTVTVTGSQPSAPTRISISPGPVGRTMASARPSKVVHCEAPKGSSVRGRRRSERRSARPARRPSTDTAGRGGRRRCPSSSSSGDRDVGEVGVVGADRVAVGGRRRGAAGRRPSAARCAPAPRPPA